MPELPEVETIRRQLTKNLAGTTIQRVVVRNPHLRYPVPVNFLTDNVPARVRSIQRHGKHLFIEWDKNTCLVVHMGMTGGFILLPEWTPPEKHDHIDFILDKGHVLRYHDPRRFGSIRLHRGTIKEFVQLNRIGPDPLNDPVNGDLLFNRSRKRKVPIKTFIMNQRVIAGIGNIYACETLFVAGIHPAKPAGSLSAEAYNALWKALIRVLNISIQAGGTTIRDFHHSDGKIGYYQQKLRVYGRAGLPCFQCHQPIHKITLQQRTSYYCPVCQHE